MIYQCYYTDKETNKQCSNRQEDYWCSDVHRIGWQEVNYVDKRVRNEHKLSTKEIQKRLLELGKKKQVEEQQKLL